MKQLKEKNIPTTILLNKVDSEKRNISNEAIGEFANKWKSNYVEVSAKTGRNVEAAIEAVITSLLTKMDK